MNALTHRDFGQIVLFGAVSLAVNVLITWGCLAAALLQ